MVAIYDPADGSHRKITIGDLNSGGSSISVSGELYDGLVSHYGSNIHAIGLDYTNLLASSCGGSVPVPLSATMAIWNDNETSHKHRRIPIGEMIRQVSGEFLLRSANDFVTFGTVPAAPADRFLIEDASSTFAKKYTTLADLTGGITPDSAKVKVTAAGTADYLLNKVSYIGGHITGYFDVGSDTLRLSGNSTGSSIGGGLYIPLSGSNKIAGNLIPTTSNSINIGDTTHIINTTYTREISLGQDIVPKNLNYCNLGSTDFSFDNIYVNKVHVPGTAKTIYSNPADDGSLWIDGMSTQQGKIVVSGDLVRDALITLYDEFNGLIIAGGKYLQCYSAATSIIYDNIGITLTGINGSTDTVITLPVGYNYLITTNFKYAGGSDIYRSYLTLYTVAGGRQASTFVGYDPYGSGMRVSQAQFYGMGILDATSNYQFKLYFYHEDVGTNSANISITMNIKQI